MLRNSVAGPAVESSVEDRTAVPSARKRQELSSGMTRRVRVPDRFGTGIVGGSWSESGGFRVKDNGAFWARGMADWVEVGAGAGSARTTRVSCSPLRFVPFAFRSDRVVVLSAITRSWGG